MGIRNGFAYLRDSNAVKGLTSIVHASFLTHALDFIASHAVSIFDKALKHGKFRSNGKGAEVVLRNHPPSFKKILKLNINAYLTTLR